MAAKKNGKKASKVENDKAVSDSAMVVIRALDKLGIDSGAPFDEVIGHAITRIRRIGEREARAEAKAKRAADREAAKADKAEAKAEALKAKLAKLREAAEKAGIELE